MTESKNITRKGMERQHFEKRGGNEKKENLSAFHNFSRFCICGVLPQGGGRGTLKHEELSEHRPCPQRSALAFLERIRVSVAVSM